MPSQDLEQIREIFLKARSLPADQQRAFLDANCGGDVDFRGEVEQLLAADTDQTLGVAPGGKDDGEEKAGLNHPAAASFPRNSLPAGYQFVRELGRGGQAVVCAAIQQSTRRTVAVKIMRDGPLADTLKRARFDREAEVLAALRHPNIVTVLDRGLAADSSQYIVMDYVQGRTLGEWLREHAARNAKGGNGSQLRMFMKICSAINAAHLRGIVHRDIKPSNILVDERDEPFVLDFGLARPLFDAHASDAPMTLTGEFLGSLPWASPEQAQGDPDKIDTRTDVYALGVVLYQLLTGGQFPYEVAGNMRDVLNNILTAEPTPPSRVMAARAAREQQQRRTRRPSPRMVNEVIEAIVLKALSKRRDDRYQTAGEFEREIANYVAGLPTIAAGQKVLKRRIRDRLVVGGSFVVALIVAGAISWRLASRHDRQRVALPGGGEQAEAQRPTVRGTVETMEPAREVMTDGGHFTNTIGMKFNRIEAGEFLMGSPANRGEERQHKVKLTRAFFMGTHHVTRGQFAAFVKDSAYRTYAEKSGWAYAYDGTNFPKVDGASWLKPGFDQADDHPVVEVCWNDAQAFCQWLSKKEGTKYRLPTEAEWEYACRAGTRTAYSWGDNPDGGQGFANSADLTAKDNFPHLGTTFNWRDGFVFTAPVGSFKPNPWGLYDMTGNAWEWCGDVYEPYGDGDAADPTGPAQGDIHVMRGGSWVSGPQQSRAACRLRRDPLSRCSDLGFRVCFEVK